MRPGRLRSLLRLAWLTWLAAAALLAPGPRGALASPGAGGDDDESRLGAADGDPGDGADRGGEDAPPPPSAAQVAGPPVGEVLAAAYRAAGLDRDPGRGWIRRARASALIPSVTVRTGRNTRWQELDPDVDRGTAIEVRAAWRLDRLLFDGRELQVASIEAARRRERRQLASRVIRAYFHWRRMASAAAAPPGRASRADEAAAELDALTDGWFSDQRGRAPPK